MSATKYPLSEEQVEQIKQLFPCNLTEDLAKQFNCSYSRISNLANRLGWKKNKDFIRETARKNMFRADHPAKKFWIKKGDIPPNKGKKPSDYMTQEAIDRMRITQFKKGQMPHNHKNVGYERVNVEGYVEVKIAEPKTFKLKHRLVWEQKYGTIPHGYNVQFKDGNRQNCHIDNLYLISRADQLKTENSFMARYPKDVQLAIQAKGALNRQINKLLLHNENS
jgi:hypothetical protein